MIIKADFDTIAQDAADIYRSLEATVEEFAQIHPENPSGLRIIERFVSLHNKFYDHIVSLTAEDTGEIDHEFCKEVLIEKAQLQEMLKHISRTKGFIETLTGKSKNLTDYWSHYFAGCVEDIFDGFAIDPTTNQIYFIFEE